MKRWLSVLFILCLSAPSFAASLGGHTSSEWATASGATTAAISTQTGSTIVVGVTYSDTFTSVTDNQSNTWTEVGTTVTNGDKIKMFYCQNCTGNASHTFTTSVAAFSFGVIVVAEFRDMLTSGVLDQNNTGTNSSTTTHTTGNITTTTADQVLVHYAQLGGGTDCTWSSPFAGNGSISDQRCNLDSTGSGVMAYRIVSSTGTYSGSIVSSQSGNSGSKIASFKASSAAAPARRYPAVLF